MESGSQPLGGGLAMTPIQLLSDWFHLMVSSMSSSIKAVGELRSSLVIPTGHPAVSSVHGTRGMLVRLASSVGPYRLTISRRVQMTPITAGSTERMRIIIGMLPP